MVHELFRDPSKVMWEFTGDGAHNTETGNVHYKSVRARQTTGTHERTFGIGDGVIAKSDVSATPVTGTGFITDMFQEAARPDDTEKGRVGVRKMRVTLRWTYTYDDIVRVVGFGPQHDQAGIDGEVYFSDDFVRGRNCVAVIQGRSWFIDNIPDFEQMKEAHLPPWHWPGDSVQLMRNVFWKSAIPPMVRRLLKGEAGDLENVMPVPLPNMLQQN